MDSDRCSIPGCTKPPKCLCKCQEPNVPICKSHILQHMEYSLDDNHNMTPFFAKLSKDEISILQKARKRLFQIKSDSISEINKDYLAKFKELREEYADKLERIMGSIDPVLKRLDNAISNNLTLRSSNDEFILKLRQSISLEGENQDRSLERSLFRCIGLLLSLIHI